MDRHGLAAAWCLAAGSLVVASWVGCGSDVAETVPTTSGTISTTTGATSTTTTGTGGSTTTSSSTDSGGSGQTCGPVDADIVTVATNQVNPQVVAVDDTNIYWINSTNIDAGLWKASKSGGAPIEVATLNGGGSGLVVDATSAYWTMYDDDYDYYAGVQTVPLGGGLPEVLVSNQPRAAGLAAMGDALYWINQGHGLQNYADGEVLTVPKEGGTPLVLASGQPELGHVAVDDANVYWTVNSVWTFESAALRKVPKGGGSPTSLVDAAYVRGLATDGVNVFFTIASTANPPNGKIMRVAVGGGDPMLVADGQPGDDAIAVHDGCVYWPGKEGIVRVPKDGGDIAPVAAWIGGAMGFAVDAAGVYWTDYTGGRVLMARFPSAP
jgi:hypothetical protein